jgi:hypothetical protein
MLTYLMRKFLVLDKEGILEGWPKSGSAQFIKRGITKGFSGVMKKITLFHNLITFPNSVIMPTNLLFILHFLC